MRRVIAAVLLAAAMLAQAAPPLPPAVDKEHPGLELLGEGTLRFFGIHVYDGSVWIASDTWGFDKLFALELRYDLKVKGAELASQSVKEWKKQGFTDEAKMRAWESQMAAVFPDIRNGDRLVGVNVPGKGALFYSQEKYLGAIEDVDFARAFFGIWLSEKTSEPKLRVQMLKLAN